MPSPPSHVPVLIVGAGPVGLLAANLLGTYGIETVLVEKNGTTSDHPKAILLDDEGFRALQTVGLADDVIERVISGYGARYYEADGSCFAEIGSPITRHGYPRRNAFLQPELERVMDRGLARFAHIGTMFETELLSIKEAGELVTARLRTSDGHSHDLSCDFVLACDGARSTVREQLRIPMPGVTDARDWVVIDTINDPDRDRFSKFFCDPKRPMVSIPAPRGGRRYEFMIMPGEDPKEMSARAMIRSTLERFRAIPDEDILRAVVYTFHARVTERLAIGRIALLGDAAHLSPPFAGQGMNAGLRDAFNIAWKLKLALDGMASKRIIETYETERKGPIKEMVDYAVALGEIVMPAGELDETKKQAIRDNLAGGVSSEGQSLTLRPKPEVIYRRGWLVPSERQQCQGLTGHAFPQFSVETSIGKTCLLDDVLGPGFALVAIGPSATAKLAALAGLDAFRLPIRNVALYVDHSFSDHDRIAAVLVRGDDFGLGANLGSIFLIRPDRFVAAEWSSDQVADIAEQIAALCTGVLS